MEHESGKLPADFGLRPSPEVRRIAAELLPLFYEELRRVARGTRARVAAGQTLQTTALVHAACLRLGPRRGFVDEGHFVRAAALAMRHALVKSRRCAHRRQAGRRPAAFDALTR